ncbi:hypothetical protein M885DRAFT_538660 [Pelagophyceae sp. CCMP2097]|nr:hypothetical protein M885DRAFT_538660 [Pelagophyceae sp. CCMP2097]
MCWCASNLQTLRRPRQLQDQPRSDAMRAVLAIILLGRGACVVQPASRRAFLAYGAAATAGVTTAGAATSVSAAPSFLEGVPLETDLAPLPSGRARQPPGGAARDDDDDAVVDERSLAAVARAQARALGGAAASASAAATERVRFGVRCARTDGTFSTRKDDTDPPLFGSLTVGLFGDAAPASVALFLTFALGPDSGPTYTRSLFDEIAEGGAVVVGGRIRGIDEKDLFGEPVLLYNGGEALSPRAEKVERLARSEKSAVAHDRAGLLTRRRRTAGARAPEFAVTLRAAPELDAEWTVFGAIEADGGGMLDRIRSLPVYSDVAVGPLATDVPLAADVFNAQRQVFRKAAKQLGDTRGQGVFPGKILRRVDVTATTLL